MAGSALEGERAVTLVLRVGARYSARVSRRTLVIGGVLLAASVALAVWSMTMGDFELGIDEVVGALLGTGSAKAHLVVVEWRLPRVLLALAVGAALGLSGAIFQSLTRNPLGSPDIIGFNTGAYTGAILVLVLIPHNGWMVAGGAMIGGILTAALVYALAWRRGVHGFRLIIVGIAVSAVLASLNTWLLLVVDLQQAMGAAIWGAGTLNGVGWDQFFTVLLVAAVLLPAMIALAPRMRLLEMGDDAASSLGVDAEKSRLQLVLVGVALTAVCTAVAGPISFVALAAPQLARRLTRSPGIALVPSAMLGALLLLASDVIAQRAFAPTQLPVGIITVALGGGYLIWLLIREARRN
ncbi:iron-enterobactin ABC transporter permease [Microbacteriaceae bacterium VKM Ac-2854]|nr:iron-enterobactin ABC transporter permease [Microbacteriaceae bacterium VKM Ac-2854]